MVRFLFKWMLILSLVGVVVAGAGAVALVHYYGRDLPDYDQLARYEPPVVTRLFAADGRLMAEYAIENRVFVPIQAIPERLVHAFVAAEDQNFYTHGGVDYLAIVRATVQNVSNYLAGRRFVGASTITQQVAKNFLLSNEVSLGRKIREALLAMRIEETFSKDEILELYLNDIYLGRGAYGVAAAALAYFNKPLDELTLPEMAFLAALPKAPNNYNPITRHAAAVARRDYVINRMEQDGYITAEEAAAARAAELVVVDRVSTEFVRADYFSEEVRRSLARLYGDQALYRGGLIVHTTLDAQLQDIATRSLREGLIGFDRRYGWRGPVAQLESFDGWPDLLAAVPRPRGVPEWPLAVVLEVLDGQARIGFVDRSQGLIPLSELRWARPALPGQRVGSEPARAGDVLELGDVVLVEPIGTQIDRIFAADDQPAADDERPRVLPAYGLRQVPEIQGALVAMDPHTGRVLAVSGGFSYEASEFNRATQAVRQPGSAIKPFVYLAALEAGYTPATIVLDTPLTLELGAQAGGDYSPRNYGGDFLGPVPMRVGIERSRNIMTVRLIHEIGLEAVAEITNRFGVYEQMDLYYSMGLGAGETTPLALTNAYAMLANGGFRVTPTFIDRIQDREGNVLFSHDTRVCPNCTEVAWADGLVAPMLPDLSERIADPIQDYQIVSMMQGVVQRGTATSLSRLGVPIAGKTGTTNDARDAWFIGFTPDLVVGVYIGYDTPRPLGPRETGGGTAVPIFEAFMAEALAGRQVAGWRPPPEAVMVAVDPRTGIVARPGEPSITEVFVPGTEPYVPTFLEGLDGGLPPLTGFSIPSNGEAPPQSAEGTPRPDGQPAAAPSGPPTVPGFNSGTGGLF